MAPSFIIGNPQRSLVRIPGSGQDKTLKPICLDVAQITSFSKNLSEIMHFDFNSSQEVTGGGTLNILPSPSPAASVTASATIGGRQEHEQRSAAATVTLTTTSTSETAQSGAGTSCRKRSADEEVSSQTSSKRSLRPNAFLNTQQRAEKYKALQAEKEKLHEENEELLKKISMFKDILRNRKKLNEFLTVLEGLPC